MNSSDKAIQKKQILAWLIHLYTALGLPINLASFFALIDHNGSLFFQLNLLAVFVDATDGFMARRIEIKKVLPSFDGAKLDDLIDFLTFTFLPLLALPILGVIPMTWSMWLSIPFMASAYGFCQTRAKTEDSFVGFPSYWNVICLYLFSFEVPAWISLLLLIWLSIMVFIPIHYVYPTRKKEFFKTTMIGGAFCGIGLLGLVMDPKGPYASYCAIVALSYTVYYTILSFFHDRAIRKASTAGTK